jgi:alpha-L-fucosidase
MSRKHGGEKHQIPHASIVPGGPPLHARLAVGVAARRGEGNSWGYQKADDDWKTPKTIVKNLITCAHDTGNYLLNIGPKPDGSIPEESVKIMTQVGRWMEKSGKSIYDTDVCQPRRSNYASFTRKGNTLYMHVHFWPGDTVALAGLMNRVQSARLLATEKPMKFEQEKFRVRFLGLPEKAPDEPVTTIAIECDGEPRQDTDFVRKERPREKA